MMKLVTVLLTVTLSACSSSEPDATSKLIAKRYADCMPGLKASDIKRISDKRYAITTDKYSAAWSVGKDKRGDTLTGVAPDSLPQMERWGCV